MEVYHRVEQLTMRVAVDEVMYHVEEILLFVLIVVENYYDYLLMFEELEDNLHWHIEVVFDLDYPSEMDQHHTEIEIQILELYFYTYKFFYGKLELKILLKSEFFDKIY